MSEIRLREFEELVLLCVLAARPEAYGASIQRVLEEEAGRSATLGAIHTALDRLTHKGLVLSAMGDPKPVRGGHRKRQYELTPSGLEEVANIRRIRERLWKKVNVGSLEGEAGP